MSKQASALAKARERRRTLDKTRDEQDQRIEEATAGALVALEARADAERALEAATGLVGEALKVLLAVDVPAEKAAALLELDVAEVRRLVKAAPADSSGRDAAPVTRAKATVSVLPDAAGGEGAARRAG
ncbi:MAG: hypothetical protein DLM61_24955 [Pseudonocardiales bacterium]|nr:MAG: hypothetical protein DLM61_24955 [Pseudonocardiales bacterium]